MIPRAVLDNLSPWLIQVLLIAAAGALLPLLFRIRHPQSRLAYCHIVLLLCFFLPLIQPWHDSLVIATPRVSDVQPAESAAVPWSAVVFWILGAGTFVRMCWLAAGLWQLSRYRKFSVPIQAVPESIREARQLTGSDATFRVSATIDGPSTMGWIDPVVLLPPSFLSLDKDAQRGIACHELLHVRRRDWLVTILEELAGAVFWFNPGVWWLLAQAKLSREQLVDGEVVQLTAREPYIQALLSMAVVSRGRWALPAASFFTRGHLIRRMRLLLDDARKSAVRLFLSYTAIGCTLAIVMWSAFTWLPLARDPHIVIAAPPAQPVRLSIRHLDAPMARRMAEFYMRLPAPEEEEDLRYFVQVTPADVPGAAEVQENILAFGPPPPPPPPPPTSGPFSFLALRGVRMVRPGEIASPEEIQKLRDALGERAVLEVQQAEDGTVQRVTIQARRLRDEANSVRTSIPFASAEPTAPANRVD
jgi:beta-lactamase regulating signal transducer with metallopeptidase domain